MRIKRSLLVKKTSFMNEAGTAYDEHYRVVAVTNSIEFSPGDRLEPRRVDALIRDGWTVRVK